MEELTEAARILQIMEKSVDSSKLTPKQRGIIMINDIIHALSKYIGSSLIAQDLKKWIKIREELKLL